MTIPALHFERIGRGPALVLLHGFTGSGHSMAGLAAALGAGFETLVPDLPGHGRSAAVRCTFDGCVDALRDILAAAGHPRAHWLGYSMGARLALGVAARHPGAAASLTLIGARAGIEDPAARAARRRADAALAERIERDGLATFVDEWLAQELFATQRRLGDAFVAAARAERLAQDPQGLAEALRHLGPGAQPPLFDALPHIRIPVLLIAGALDPPFTAAAHDLARRLPNAAVHEIDDAGHAAHLERPAAVAGIARRFLLRAGHGNRTDRRTPALETLS